MNPFFGAGGVFLWQGVVEDRFDPLECGRVRVRVIGLHSGDISDEGLPVDSLKWAQVSQHNAAMNGIGESSSNFVEGTWVFGISMDGRLYQDLIVLGSLAGKPNKSPNTMFGFGDHDRTSDINSRPRRPNDSIEHYPKSAYLNEPDVNRLARNSNIDKTIVALKRATIDNCALFSEPSNPYNAKYPFNTVSESESGHIREVDDTPGNERVHDYHRSGSFTEIHPNGTKVSKIVGDNYTIVANGENVHIGGVCNVVIDGDSNIITKGNSTQIVEGNSTHTTNGHATVNAPTGTDHDGTITVNGDVIADGKSLINHTHTGNLGFATSPPN